MRACYGRWFSGVESPLLPGGMEKTELVLTLPIGPPAYAHGLSPRHCYYTHLSIIISEFLKIVITPAHSSRERAMFTSISP